MFAGSSHQNYTTYLLEVYCFLRYEASKDLRDGVLNNWLVNITGELGKWIEGDLLQEHYNRWLEDQVQKRGGNFDDNSTKAPSPQMSIIFCASRKRLRMHLTFQAVPKHIPPLICELNFNFSWNCSKKNFFTFSALDELWGIQQATNLTTASIGYKSPS